jgi:GTP cyclohydrolase FolE2
MTTMQPYNNPVFVEDVVRNTAGFLEKDSASRRS